MATELFGQFKLRNLLRFGFGVGVGVGVGFGDAVVAWLTRPAADPPIVNTGSSQ